MGTFELWRGRQITSNITIWTTYTVFHQIELHVNTWDQTGEEVNEILFGWECLQETKDYDHQEQQLLVDASDSGGFCLKMFFFTPADPSVKRLGVSKICRSSWYHHINNISYGSTLNKTKLVNIFFVIHYTTTVTMLHELSLTILCLLYIHTHTKWCQQCTWTLKVQGF